MIVGMTGETPKPKRKRWRWIIAGVFLFLAVAAGRWYSIRPTIDATKLVGRWANPVDFMEWRFKSDGTFKHYGPGDSLGDGRFTISGNQLVFLPQLRPPGFAGYIQDLKVAIALLRGTPVQGALDRTDIDELTDTLLRLRAPGFKGGVVEWKDATFRRVVE